MAIDLVTGATGLLGGNLVRMLSKQGRHVRALVREKADVTYLRSLPNVELIKGDITIPSSLTRPLQGVEHVYHCAALTFLWKGMAAQLQRVNVDGTKHILQAATRAGVGRFIYCSSVDALGIPEGKAPATEVTPWNWDRLGVENPYARTKYEAQKCVLEATGDKLDVVVVNPTTMFGPYDLRPSSGQIILLIAGGKLPFYPTGGDNFVAVEDVVIGMMAAAEKGHCGACYILGNENVTYRRIFTRIADILHQRPPRFRVPYQISRIGGWAGDFISAVTGKEQTINSSTVQMGALHHYYSAQKAVDELEMPQTSVDEAIKRAVQWFFDAGKITRSTDTT
ncbi:MAG: SDR family oxidoreductase [Gemmatimonadota bacterium]|nr:SDR family oxidoreductase [Gemmatimonadota bacterium]